ncbi:MAG: hypothetical protein HYS13_10720 [Planctomycetia bacterium]|nr:hypothetical protein [Planctomycetia bacterium]
MLWRWVSLTTLVALGAADIARACPFCEGVKTTLSMEAESYDEIVLARLADRPRDAGKSDVPTARFEVFAVLKGAEILPGGQASRQPFSVEAILVANAKLGTPFLLRGTRDAGRGLVEWSVPIELNDRGVEYVRRLATLPAKGPERLAFILPYLDDDNDVLSTDAYAEFALAPYADLRPLREKLDPDALLGKAMDQNNSSRLRRLYLTMLGVCGNEKHARAIEALFAGPTDRPRQEVDAAVAAFLAIRRETGLPIVEETFLANAKADPGEVAAVVAAIRFHGDDAKLMSRVPLAASLRQSLHSPESAERVIGDLARWEDWSALPRLVELFVSAGETQSFVRQQILQYLDACPLPEAKAQFARLEKLEPQLAARVRSGALGAPDVPTVVGAAPVPPPALDAAPVPPPSADATTPPDPRNQPRATALDGNSQRSAWRTAIVVVCLILGFAILWLGLRGKKPGLHASTE